MTHAIRPASTVRAGEERYVAAALGALGVPILMSVHGNGTFEGADAMWAAPDLCFVADGTYEGFWERRLHTWDVCAGSALVLAAGGRVTSLDGTPARYHSGRIVASNGLVHAALVDAIAKGEKRAI